MVRRPLRYLETHISSLAFARGKMAFVSGPRQVGKTTLGKRLLKERERGTYFTWEDIVMRRTWVKNPSALLGLPDGGGGESGNRPLFIFDEIHKAKGWKTTIKGLYDLHGDRCDLFVTGSARLNVYRRGADSLMGRYLHFRLHPFSMGELLGRNPVSANDVLSRLSDDLRRPTAPEQAALEELFRFGGFPEPLFSGETRTSNLWRRNRLEKIIREDLRDLSRIPELGRIEMLASLLPERVGSLLSVQSLREDLEVAHDTARRWLDALDELYYLYEIKPYSRSIPRSLRKEGKLYLWDWTEVEDQGPRFENLVAGHLAKACAFWTDTGEGLFELSFLRDKEKREVDFLVTRDRKPWLAVEAKLSDVALTPAFASFERHLGSLPCVQLVRKAISPKQDGSHFVMSAASFLPFLP